MRNLLKPGLSLIAGCSALVASAHATAVYSATVDATLTLLSVTPADTMIEGETVFVDFFDDAVGAATSTGSAFVTPAVTAPLITTPIVIDLDATGESTGIGFASSGAESDGSVEFFNMSTTDSIVLDFELIYSVGASVAVDVPGPDFADAFASLYVENGASFDGPLVEIEFAAASDTQDTDFSIADAFLFSITIPPQSDIALVLSALVFGSLDSALENTAVIPIPPVAPLFALTALAFLRNNRRAAN